jgi:ATP phosphoribosyltransferase regulatory subunit HisZ
MDKLFDEMDELLDSFINTPPHSTSEDSQALQPTTSSPTPIQAISSHQYTPIHNILNPNAKSYHRRDVILISSARKKEKTVKSNAQKQLKQTEAKEENLDHGMELADFFKTGPIKRRTSHIQNTSLNKKRKFEVVYSKHQKAHEF